MQRIRWPKHKLIALALLGTIAQVQAGQTPGMPGTWNGPWGSGFLNGEPYSPLASPYIGAGYPVAAPYPYGPAGRADGGYPMQGPSPMQAQPRELPGGGYLLPPGPGGGMMPGAYANH
jgi:hypothetical protein